MVRKIKVKKKEYDYWGLSIRNLKYAAQYFVLTFISLWVFLGTEVFKMIENPEVMIMWIWVSITLILMVVFFVLLFKFVWGNTFMLIAALMTMFPMFGSIDIMKISYWMFVIGLGYNIFRELGLGFKGKVYWRGKRV